MEKVGDGGRFAWQSRDMDRDLGDEKQRDQKKDLEVSDLPSNKPKGIYEMKKTAFIRPETDRWWEEKKFENNIGKNRGII